MRTRARQLAVLLAGLTALAVLTPGSPGSPATAHAAPAPVAGPEVAASAERGPQAAAQSVVVVGVPGLRWSDVAAMPALSALVDRSAVGSLSVKARPAVSCPADGFLTLGAGGRAEAFGTDCDAVPDLAAQSDLVRRNAGTRDAAALGVLGSALPPTECVNWNGDLAQLALLRRRAVLGAGPQDDRVATAPLPLRSTAGPAGGLQTCRLTVLESPAVAGEGEQRRGATRQADALVEALTSVVRPGTALLVVGVSGAPGEEAAHLHVALATGAGFERCATGGCGLRSASTRRDGLVQLVDVAPTALELLGVDAAGLPEGVIGQPWRTVADQPSLAELVDADELAVVETDVRVPFFVAYLAALLGLLVALWRRPRVARVVALTGALVPVASYAANLVPWWRTGRPLLALLGLSVGLALAVALPASRLRGRLAPVAVVLLTGTAVVVADLLTGASLQLSSVAGYSPLVAGRFAGLGNVAFGVLAGCAVLGAAATRSAPLAVLVLGLVAVVDGAPAWGSDVGGVLALVPGLAVLVLRLQGRRVSVLRVGLAGLVGALVVTAFALADRTRTPDERTHLGRFAQQVVDGQAGTVLRRKADAVFGLLFTSPVTALLPLVVAVAVLLVVRPPRVLRTALDDAPAWRSGLAALGVTCLLGFALNDSGAAVPALALVVALPATAAVVLGASVREPAAPDR